MPGQHGEHSTGWLTLTEIIDALLGISVKTTKVRLKFLPVESGESLWPSDGFGKKAPPCDSEGTSNYGSRLVQQTTRNDKQTVGVKINSIKEMHSSNNSCSTIQQMENRLSVGNIGEHS